MSIIQKWAILYNKCISYFCCFKYILMEVVLHFYLSKSECYFAAKL